METNSGIRCIVVDDEYFAVWLISDYVRKVAGMEVVLETSSAITALDAIQAGRADVVFLDIQMPELTGLELAEIIKAKAVQVIFITAYGDYALEGFDYDATDYLLKPVTFERFLLAVDKIKRRITAANSTFSGYIFIKTEYKLQKIYLNSILYIQGLGDYVIYHTITGKIISLERMKNVQRTLSEQGFLRIHKSYIVNMGGIDRLERDRIVFGEEYLLIGQTYKSEVKKRMGMP